MIGMFSRNAALHEMVSTRMPPIAGPSSVVPEEAPDQIPNARPRNGPSKPAVIKASEPGTRNAPATPCRTRSTTSVSRFGARPHRADMRPNPARPSMNMRFLPYASVSAPARMSSVLSDRR
jgi:hypothetical protein